MDENVVLKNLDSAIALRNLDLAIAIQSQPGNWDYDPYMHGLLNGLLFARSCITGEEPKFYKPPEKWKKDHLAMIGPSQDIQA